MNDFTKVYTSYYGPRDERVFQWTQFELQDKIDIGQEEVIPTLEELIELCKEAPGMLMNIELKGPLADVWA